MGCVHSSQQLSLAEEGAPAVQCPALGCGLGTSGLCWAVSQGLPCPVQEPLGCAE